MKIIDVKKYELDGEGTVAIKLNNNLKGDTVCGEMYIEPQADIELSVKGYVEDVAHALKVVDMGTFSIEETIATSGVYMLPAGAYNKVEISYDGTADVVVKMLY